MNTPFFISCRTLRADLTGAFQVIFRQGDPGAGPQGRTLKSPLSTAQQALPPGKGCFMLVKGQAGDGWNTKTTPLLGTKYALNCLRMRRMVSSYSKRAQKRGHSVEVFISTCRVQTDWSPCQRFYLYEWRVWGYEGMAWYSIFRWS